MNRYTIEVITQVLTIDAPTQYEAELKYEAYFSGEPCPCGAEDCFCVEDSEDCYHTTELAAENI